MPGEDVSRQMASRAMQSSSPRRQSTVASEFTVRFYGAKAVGLGFHQAALQPGEIAYACVVSDVLPDSQAASYNAQCRGSNDLSRLLAANVSLVAKVNGEDVRGVPYSEVVKRCDTHKSR